MELLMVRRKWLTLMVTVNQVGVVSHPQPLGALGSPLCTLYSVRLSTSRGVLDTRNISTAVTTVSKHLLEYKDIKDPVLKLKDPFKRGKVSSGCLLVLHSD